MTHIVDIELALNVVIERRIGHHILDVRNLALKSGLVYGQEAVLFYADTHRLAVLHLFRLNGHHTTNRGFHKAYGLIKPLALFFGKLFFEHTLQDLIGIVEVLANDNIKGAFIHLPTLAQSGNNIGNDEFKNSCANGRCHNIAICNGVYRFRQIAVCCSYILYPNILMALGGYDTDGVLFLLPQSLDHRLCYIDKGDLIAALT